MPTKGLDGVFTQHYMIANDIADDTTSFRKV